MVKGILIMIQVMIFNIIIEFTISLLS